MASPKRRKILQDNIQGFTNAATLSVFKLAFLNPHYYNQEQRAAGRSACKGPKNRINDLHKFQVSPDIVPLIRVEIEALCKHLLPKVALYVQSRRAVTVTQEDIILAINRDISFFPFLKGNKGSYADLLASSMAKNLDRRYPLQSVRRYMIEYLQNHGSGFRISSDAVEYLKYVIEAMVFFIGKHAMQIANVSGMRSIKVRHVFLAINMLREVQGQAPLSRKGLIAMPNALNVGATCTTSPRKRKRSRKSA